MSVIILPTRKQQQPTTYRENKTEAERKFYSSQRWRKTSERHRRDEPLCRQCRTEGRYIIGTLTDHIVPISHGCDPYDEANHQTLCDKCHNRKRKQESLSK